MLFGQNLGRRHECAEPAVFPALPDERRGDERFAAAHVTLHETVHDAAGAEIIQRFVDSAALRSGRGEGESAIEFLDVMSFKADAALSHTLPADTPERTGEEKQLLKDQPSPGDLKRAEIGGEVDVLIGIRRRGESAAKAKLFREYVRDLIGAERKRLADCLQYAALVDASVQTEG